ncbi:MAG: electron transfer flavoprotein subunit beta/FixA family protein [Candidatus Delongbacteria bacterium]
MRIVVCLKRVPDTESVIRLTPDGTTIERGDLNYIINPYDEYALEAALQLKEAEGGEVVLLCAGEAEADSTLRKGLAMGADEAVLLQVPQDLRDPWSTARLLADWLRAHPADLILAGKQGVDYDHGAVPGMLAELLGLPSATAICALERVADGVRVEREVEAGRERIRLPLPCVLSADKGLNEPRYASLKGIMLAKKKPLEVLESQAAPEAEAGRVALPPARPAGRVIGEGAQAAGELLRLLKEEARVL